MSAQRGGGSIYPRGVRPIWWIKYYHEGECYRESSRSTKESEARKLLKRRLGEISTARFIGPAADKVTVRELAQDFLNDYEINGKRLDRAKRSVAALLNFFGGARAHDLTTNAIRKYIASRMAEGAAPATINRELAALKRAYNLALQAERVGRRPHIPMLAEDNVRLGFFEHAEFLALRVALPEYFKPVVTFAYYTGCRKGEVLSLRWSQVDLDAGTIRLDPGMTKTGEGRVIALEGELAETMRDQWQRRIIEGPTPALSALVFHRDGKPIGDFRDSWATACRAARLPGKLFHDFRRTAVRNMIRAGVPERVAMKVSGHRTRSVFDRYNIVNEDDLKEAARRVWSHAQRMNRLRILGHNSGTRRKTT